jgi:hypothetical protein
MALYVSDFLSKLCGLRSTHVSLRLCPRGFQTRIRFRVQGVSKTLSILALGSIHTVTSRDSRESGKSLSKNGVQKLSLSIEVN